MWVNVQTSCCQKEQKQLNITELFAPSKENVQKHKACWIYFPCTYKWKMQTNTHRWYYNTNTASCSLKPVCETATQSYRRSAKDKLSRKQSLETFPLGQSGTTVSWGKFCFHWGVHDFQHCYFCRWHSLKIILVMLWGTLRDKRARFDGPNIVSTPLSRVSRQLQRQY